MGKDPACLWYWADWNGGTFTMSRALKGAYMDLLFAQFNNGRLSLDEIKTVLGSDFGSMWPTLQKKFVKDDEGFYCNQKLHEESIKRKSFTKSRRENAATDKHMPKHMENENVIINEIRKEEIEFTALVNTFSEYTDEMRIEFCRYWTEKNKTGKKMRFETEKTFEVSKRLAFWASRSREFNKTAKPAFPDTYDGTLYNKLYSEPQKLKEYQSHLRTLGFFPVYGDGAFKTTVKYWTKKQDAA